MMLWIILCGVMLLIMLGVFIYNNLVKARNMVGTAFTHIDVQLKERHDLVSKLVETAHAYLGYECSTLDSVVAARGQAQLASQAASQRHPQDAKSLTALCNAESVLSHSLGRFFVLAENYPDLKTNQTMMQLSKELNVTESKLAFARQTYNEAVIHFNRAVESFPALLFASGLGFKRSSLLQSLESEHEHKTPNVKF